MSVISHKNINCLKLLVKGNTGHAYLFTFFSSTPSMFKLSVWATNVNVSATAKKKKQCLTDDRTAGFFLHFAHHSFDCSIPETSTWYTYNDNEEM